MDGEMQFDIARKVATLTEDDLDVESEKASHGILS
jgi:hypothetical protein